MLRHPSLVALVLLSPAALAQEWPGRIVDEDGVTHVYNPTEPHLNELVLTAEPLFRIEGEGDEYLLGTISRIRVDEMGRSYFLDSQLDCVWVFDAEGRYLHSVGREGEAPGEWIQSFSMMLLPEDRLAVIQVYPTRMVMLTRDGQPLDDFSMPDLLDGSRRMLMDSASSPQGLILELVTPEFDGQSQTDHTRLVGVGWDGKERCLYGESTRTSTPGQLVLGRDREGIAASWSTDAAGTLYSVPRHREYRVESYSPDGELVRVVHREYETLALNDEERERLKRSVSYSGMAEPSYVFAKDAVNRDVASLLVRDNGELWIQSSRLRRELGEDMLAGSELHDPEGRLLRRVRVEFDHDPERDWASIVGDRLYLIENAKGMWAAMRAGMGSQVLGEDEEAVEEGEDLEDIELAISVYRLPYACDEPAP